MIRKQRVKLLRIDDVQTIQIPKEMELDSEEVVLQKEGNRIILVPVEPESLIDYLKSIDAPSERLPEIDDLPIDDIRL